MKVKFHNYQSHLCCLSLIGGVQQEDQDTWGAGSAALSNVYTPEKFLSLAFAVSRLPTVNLSVFPKSSERSSINCLTTCILFVMFCRNYNDALIWELLTFLFKILRVSDESTEATSSRNVSGSLGESFWMPGLLCGPISALSIGCGKILFITGK